MVPPGLGALAVYLARLEEVMTVCQRLVPNSIQERRLMRFLAETTDCEAGFRDQQAQPPQETQSPAAGAGQG